MPLPTKSDFLPILLSIGVLLPWAGLAATRQEYTAASAKWLEILTRPKSMGVVKRVLEQPVPRPVGKKQMVYGRGEVMPARPLANLGASLHAMGRDSEAKVYFDDVLLIFAACARTVLDGYDDPTPDYDGSTDQVSFALPELARAYQVMVELKQFNDTERERARQMLLACAEFRVRKMPDGGEGNLGSRYCLGPVMVANALEAEGKNAPAIARKNLPLAPTFDAWRKRGAASFRAMMQYGWKDGAPTGRRKMMEKTGKVWNRVDAPLPSAPKPGLGFCEDSSGYGAATIINLFLLVETIPPAYLPEIAEQATWREIHDFIDGYRQLFMPVGTIPNFGDSTLGTGAGTWACLFELAGKFFQDRARWGNSAALFRDTADRIFHYQADVCGGIYGEDLDLALECMVEGVSPEPTVPRSFLLTRQGTAGCRVPYKIILRGDATAGTRQEQPYALVNVSPGESHCHGDVGCLGAYGTGGSVLLHEAGYDAGPAFFHDQFIVRPAAEPFLPFTKVFADPKGTLLNKIDANRRRVGDITLGRDWRNVRGAAMHETKYVSWGLVTGDYTLDAGYGGGYKGKYLVHTRQVALMRASGTLVVFDTIEAKEAVKGVNVGQLWHVQHVLARDRNRFLCQDDAQSILGPNTPKPTVIGTPARPLVVAMTGPDGAVYDNVQWRFLMRHGREEVPAQNHLSASVRWDMATGDNLAFITILTPLPTGTTTLPRDSTPAQVTKTTATVCVDNLLLAFGNRAVKAPDGQRTAVFTVSKGTYSAAIIENGATGTRLQETP